jgi:hypothetical protein
VTRPQGPAGDASPGPFPGAVGPPAILAAVEELVRSGKVPEATRLAFLTAEDDVRRAFGMKLPAQWTHRDFLEKYLRADMGYVTVLLRRLYALFEPARYGCGAEASGAVLMPLLRSIYQEPALRSLPLSPTARPSPSIGSRRAAPAPAGR